MRAVNRLAPALLLATLLLPTSAVAANDVVIDHLSGVESSRRQATFEFVVRDLAMALSGPPNHAVASLGLYEFEVSTDHRLAFLHVDPDAVGGS